MERCQDTLNTSVASFPRSASEQWIEETYGPGFVELLGGDDNGLFRSRVDPDPQEVTYKHALEEIEKAIAKINELDLWAEAMYHPIEEHLDRIETVLAIALKRKKEEP